MLAYILLRSARHTQWRRINLSYQYDWAIQVLIHWHFFEGRWPACVCEITNTNWSTPL